MKWEEGRQSSGYEKMTIFISKRLKCDMYLLKFNEGSEIIPHIDGVDEEYEHHRINIILKKPKEGGEFICENTIFANSRIKYFRPDVEVHSVSKIIKGTRYVLSIGWLRKIK